LLFRRPKQCLASTSKQAAGALSAIDAIDEGKHAGLDGVAITLGILKEACATSR